MTDASLDPVDARLGAVADKQYGVITARQLQQAGLSRNQICGRVKRGNLIRLHRGVYALARRGIGQRGHLQAALLALPTGAFLSHRTAAALRGLRSLNSYDIHVSISEISVKTRSSFRVHQIRTAPERWEVGTVGGMRVSTIPRLLVELSETESEQELLRLIEQSVIHQNLNHDRVRQALALHAHRPGIGRLRIAYAAYEPAPDRASRLERAFDRALLKHPEIPQPVRNIWIGPWEIDCYWPEQRLVLELDGHDYHRTVKKIERDRLRDARLLARGIRTLRITDSRFEHDESGSFDDLKLALGIHSQRAA